MGQAFAYLAGIIEYALEGEKLLLPLFLQDYLTEGASRHVFQDEETLPLGFLNVEQGGDVGMVQCGNRLRLQAKPRDPLPVCFVSMTEEFQGYRTVEPEIAGFVDYSHPAFPKTLQYLIVRNDSTNHYHFSGCLEHRT
jgi:hypothetical protein